MTELADLEDLPVDTVREVMIHTMCYRSTATIPSWHTYRRLLCEGINIKKLADHTHRKERSQQRCSVGFQLGMGGVLRVDSVHLLQAS